PPQKSCRVHNRATAAGRDRLMSATYRRLAALHVEQAPHRTARHRRFRGEERSLGSGVVLGHTARATSPDMRAPTTISLSEISGALEPAIGGIPGSRSVLSVLVGSWNSGIGRCPRCSTTVPVSPTWLCYGVMRQTVHMSRRSGPASSGSGGATAKDR